MHDIPTVPSSCQAEALLAVEGRGPCCCCCGLLADAARIAVLLLRISSNVRHWRNGGVKAASLVRDHMMPAAIRLPGRSCLHWQGFMATCHALSSAKEQSV